MRSHASAPILRSHGPSYCHPHPHPIYSYPFVSDNTQPALVLDSRKTTWLVRILAHCLPYADIAHLTTSDNYGYVDVHK